MLHLIDAIVPQTDIEAGDILIFDNGKPRLSLTYFMTFYLQHGQSLFYNSPYRSSYLHAALCSAKDEKQVIHYHHLHYTSFISGHNTIDERNLVEMPFHRPMIIIKPKNQALRQALLTTTDNIQDQQVQVNKGYYLTDLQQTRYNTPNTLASDNTCIGFIINIIQQAYELIDKPCDIQQSSSTTEMLAYALQHSDDFSLCLAPSKNPEDLLELITQFVEQEATRLEQVYFFRESALDKAVNIRQLIASHPQAKNTLQDLQRLLSQLKPEMTKARILWPSQSFYHLMNELENEGAYTEYFQIC